jgi:hypothetical protein
MDGGWMAWGEGVAGTFGSTGVDDQWFGSSNVNTVPALRHRNPVAVKPKSRDLTLLPIERILVMPKGGWISEPAKLKKFFTQVNPIETSNFV